MNPWQITLTAIGSTLLGLLVAAIILLVCGKVKLKIAVHGDVRISVYLCGIRIWSNAKKQKALAKVKPKKKKKQKTKSTEEKSALNLLEELRAILFTVKQALKRGKGKITLRIRRFHIRVATDDPAKTAILWGSTVGAASLLLEWIQANFNPIRRHRGAVNIYPDYLAARTDADIQLELSIPPISLLLYAIGIFSDYKTKKSALRRCAKRRAERKKAAMACSASQTETNEC